MSDWIAIAMVSIPVVILFGVPAVYTWGMGGWVGLAQFLAVVTALLTLCAIFVLGAAHLAQAL